MVVWVNWETRKNRFATRQGALSQGTALKSAKSSMTRECHVLFREGLEVKFLRATRPAKATDILEKVTRARVALHKG
jgi:hypothetical protein